MFKIYFRTALRNISRHTGFSAINIAGLTLGLTSCILIGLFVWDEYQYDKNIPGGESVYRIYSEHQTSEGSDNFSITPPMIATTLQNEFPEVNKTVRVLMSAEYKILFETNRKKLYEQDGLVVDSTFFEVFPFTFRHGSSLKALDDPSSIVISAELAQRYFGDTDPVGKQILVDKQPLIVKAVFEKNPRFHLQFDFLRPMSATAAYIPAERMQSWGWQQFFTYVKLKEGTNAGLLNAKFQRAFQEKAYPSIKEDALHQKIYFQPLQRIHLYSAGFKFDIAERGNITYVRGLVIIAVFILLIACFNFINLATAKSLQRAREVGVRKTIGAGKGQLIVQFISETLLLTMISIALSVFFAFLLLPWLNSFTGKNIPYWLFANPVVIVLLFILTLLVGLLAGFYPAVVLSGFKAVHVLKASWSGDKQSGKIPWLRHGLVVLQFSISALLIISAIIVFRQVGYLHNKDLGFNKEQIMFFPMRGDLMREKKDAFKDELNKAPGVYSVSIGYGFPGDAVAGDDITVPRNGQMVSLPITQLTVDFDYIKTLGLTLVAGRDFSRSMGMDEDHAWIINENAVKYLGFGTPQKALGQTLAWHRWEENKKGSLKTGQVIGVVKDFNYKSLYDKVEPAIIQIYPPAAWKVAVKLKTKNAKLAIESIKKVWNRFSPDFPLEYKFLDENFEQMYKMEDKLKSLLSVFTGIAIFVGCLGLFGLAAYAAERRKKEVGIRKVLGATTQAVVVLLSKDFIKLVIVSLVIASPLAGYLMEKWLQDFAYRINIGWWVFVLASVAVIGIALITVSFQALKAARANPVKSIMSQ